MPHLDSTRYLYRGLDEKMSMCMLDLYALEDQRIAVICSEVADNPGSCVTNCACQLAAAVCASWKIDPRNLVWIEHNPERGGAGVCLAALWELVTFRLNEKDMANCTFSDPSWRAMGRGDFDALGLPFPGS